MCRRIKLTEKLSHECSTAYITGILIVYISIGMIDKQCVAVTSIRSNSKHKWVLHHGIGLFFFLKLLIFSTYFSGYILGLILISFCFAALYEHFLYAHQSIRLHFILFSNPLACALHFLYLCHSDHMSRGISSKFFSLIMNIL